MRVYLEDNPPARQQFRLDALQRARSHGAVIPGTYREVYVRFGYLEFAEETRRHAVVIVLPGVDDRFLVAPAACLGGKRGELNELRPRPNNGKYVHGERVPPST